jgi:CDP-paratose 2-epimerase
VAHFLIRAAAGAPLILYGDGMQVRDILFVDDLVDAFLAAHQQIDRTAGRAFNIGGGVSNTTSLLEFVDLITEICGARPSLTFSAWRPGDQRYYVSDIRAFGETVGWAPRVGVREGLERLHRWVLALRERSAPKALAAVSAP